MKIFEPSIPQSTGDWEDCIKEFHFSFFIFSRVGSKNKCVYVDDSFGRIIAEGLLLPSALRFLSVKENATMFFLWTFLVRGLHLRTSHSRRPRQHRRTPRRTRRDSTVRFAPCCWLGCRVAVLGSPCIVFSMAMMEMMEITWDNRIWLSTNDDEDNRDPEH